MRQHKMYDPFNGPPPFVPNRKFSFLERSRARVGRFLLSEKWAVGIVRAPIHAFLDTRRFVATITRSVAPGPLDFLADCFGSWRGETI